MPWFSKTFVAVAARRQELIDERRKKWRNRKRLKCETFAERCIAKHLSRLGFVGQWKFGPGISGRYRADFYHRQFRIVVEIDGYSHLSEKAKEYDAKRTENLKNIYGVREVMRFTNEDVILKDKRKNAVRAIKTRLWTFRQA